MSKMRTGRVCGPAKLCLLLLLAFVFLSSLAAGACHCFQIGFSSTWVVALDEHMGLKGQCIGAAAHTQSCAHCLVERELVQQLEHQKWLVGNQYTIISCGFLA